LEVAKELGAPLDMPIGRSKGRLLPAKEKTREREPGKENQGKRNGWGFTRGMEG
jgi:hypothetical protein